MRNDRFSDDPAALQRRMDRMEAVYERSHQQLTRWVERNNHELLTRIARPTWEVILAPPIATLAAFIIAAIVQAPEKHLWWICGGTFLAVVTVAVEYTDNRRVRWLRELEKPPELPRWD